MASSIVSDSEFVELVELVYQAGCDPSRWRDFVERMQQRVPFGAFSAILAVDGTKLIQASATAGHDPSNIDKYIAHYHAVNCYEPLLLHVPVGKVITGTELAPRDWLKKQVFFNEWLVPSGNFTRGCTLTMAKDDTRLLRAFFDLPEKYADTEDLVAQLLGRLGPHILRAFELNERLGAASIASTSLDAILASLDGAAFLVARNGRVVSHNERAEMLSRSGSCVKLTTGQRLRFSAPADQTAFDRACRSAIDATRAAFRPFRLASAGDHDLIAIVSPVRGVGAAGEPSAPGALLVIKPLVASRRRSHHALRQLFGLTEREALVIEAIGGGASPAEAAATLGVSKVTVRNQLAAAMVKMGAHRQAEVVAMVANLSPRLSDDSGA